MTLGTRVALDVAALAPCLPAFAPAPAFPSFFSFLEGGLLGSPSFFCAARASGLVQKASNMTLGQSTSYDTDQTDVFDDAI